MKIRTRLKWTVWITLVAILLMIASLVWAYRMIARSDRALAATDKMQELIFERVLLRDEFIFSHGERSRNLWLKKNDALRDLLGQSAEFFPLEKDNLLIRHALEDVKESIVLFQLITQKHLRNNAAINNSAIVSESEAILVTQLALNTYELKDIVDRLNESAKKEASRARDTGVLISFIAVVIGALAIYFNTLIVTRALSRRIATISLGIGVFGSGNLDYRMPEEGEDELSELVNASNEMVDKLKNSYTSIDHLKREIQARHQAEKEIKKLNSELEDRVAARTAQLEAANRELEMFSYSVSHDLRAPLRHLIGFVELLNKRAPDVLDDKIRHYLEVITTSANQMSHLVDDLLSFSRMGRSQMGIVRVDFNQVVSDIVKVFHNETKDRIIEWQISPLPVVRGDMAMLQVAMMNLIGNAIKFTRNRDKAEIGVSWTSGSSGESIISVRDNGVGFDMKYVDKLFNIFQRLHRSEEFEGTGVGLANVRRIVKRHGGDTWAEGEVGKGAAFFFSLPPEKKQEGTS